MTNFNNYIGDELAHKVRALTKALDQAQKIISELETENLNLTEALSNINVLSKEENILDSEVVYS